MILIRVKNRIVLLLQLLLVMTYIIFEELIWEGVAKPIYEAIHSLKILQTLEHKLQDANPSVILVLFVGLLILVEAFGLYAGVLFVSGQMLLGLLLYLSKIPIAAFTFWLFRVSEAKLMRFGWFKWLYEKIMGTIDWLKSQPIYHDTMLQLGRLKRYLKQIKKQYFSNKSQFLLKIKALYHHIKGSLKR